ncbi:MAG: copper resistance D family protein [Rhodanobacteraceae bacterium]
MLACRLAVLPQAGHDHSRLQRGLLRWLGVALALLTLASFGILLSRTLELNGDVWNTLFADMRLALLVTHFGHVWWWRVPSLLVLWLGWWWSMRHPKRAWTAWPMALAVAAIALTRSDTGHPADHGDFTLAVWVDWLHILAAGTWVGSLFGMSLAVFPRLLDAGRASLGRSAEIFQRLSTLSGVALAVLVACGTYNAITQLGSVYALWTTRYGITLDAKLAIVVAMIAIGAHNRYLKLPRLRRAAGDTREEALSNPQSGSASRIVRACASAVLLEAVLGIAVIGATAALIHSMPPADMRGMGGGAMESSSAPLPPAIGPIAAAGVDG